MSVNWKAFFANGGYSNENSDPASYDDDDVWVDDYDDIIDNDCMNDDCIDSE